MIIFEDKVVIGVWDKQKKKKAVGACYTVMHHSEFLFAAPPGTFLSVGGCKNAKIKDPP